MSYNKYVSNCRRNRNYHAGSNKHIVNVGDKGKEVLENMGKNHPIIMQFHKHAFELDDKHDRFEKLVKYSRDITLESKRIIFLLHTLDAESKTDTIFNDAEIRLKILTKTVLRNIAFELRNQNPYQYLRSYTTGLQEYIEAITFFSYLKTKTLPDWIYLQKNLTYNEIVTVNEVSNKNSSDSLFEINTLVTPNEYILGVADLTGELMRKCINNLAFADTVNCYKTCDLVKEIYKGYSSCVGICSKEIRRKLAVLRQNLIKIENVCYTIKVRGSEVPEHMLVDVAIGAAENYDAENDERCHVY